MKNKPLVSVIIPAYNEETVIGDCLESLKDQSYKPLEIITVDDGSTDHTVDLIKKSQLSVVSSQLLHQQHLGPGPARNLGASKAKGEILIFVDADMTFDEDFVKDLIAPILKGNSVGTFSKNEMVKNKDNIWSICWNINRGAPRDKMLPDNYPDHAPVFRAILKSEFNRVGGFDTTGEYTDDWSLSRKLKVQSTLATGAVYYHYNPANLKEVWKQARWIGKNEFISGTFIRRIRSFIFYSFPMSVLTGLYKSPKRQDMSFLVFKIIYDLAIWISVVKSFLGEKKFK